MNKETEFVLNEALKLVQNAGGRVGKLELWTSNHDLILKLDRKAIKAATLCDLTCSAVGDSRNGRFMCLQLPNKEGKYAKDSDTFFASEEWVETLEGKSKEREATQRTKKRV